VASLFNDRAIAYRVHHGFDHSEVALSAGIQFMVRSNTGSSGVMFTLDTDTGFPDVVLITSAYGLGETVVQGAVNPDEFYVFKPTLESGKQAIVRRTLGTKALRMVYDGDGAGTITEDTPQAERERYSISDDDVHELARQAVTIEKHYGRPMDIEWAKDGLTEELRSRSDHRVQIRRRPALRPRHRLHAEAAGQHRGGARVVGVDEQARSRQPHAGRDALALQRVPQVVAQAAHEAAARPRGLGGHVARKAHEEEVGPLVGHPGSRLPKCPSGRPGATLRRMPRLPDGSGVHALLLDLDDTILDGRSGVAQAWDAVSALVADAQPHAPAATSTDSRSQAIPLRARTLSTIASTKSFPAFGVASSAASLSLASS